MYLLSAYEGQQLDCCMRRSEICRTHSDARWQLLLIFSAVMKLRGDGSKVPSQTTEEEPPSLASHVCEQHMCRTRPPDLMS